MQGKLLVEGHNCCLHIVCMYLHGGSVKSLCCLENPLGCCQRINIDCLIEMTLNLLHYVVNIRSRFILYNTQVSKEVGVKLLEN